ncbi:hypothetical protein RQP53_04105 [Paucibacter sp. APW11]|uniref:Uncharacterized protein n=1 Tax=Roseateles aquae TaxID=3077235 RepID=A0ABU3P9P8_9BURK|nr:hypothetical protein [Paucibacter sp. APW11]MDT8998456.1 hypothetical protein [Paucibacter sp. APW11]
MHGLAQFDRLLSQAQSARLWGASAVQAPLHLLDPHGHEVAELSATPSSAEILAAAYRLQADDWCGLLADEASDRSRHPGQPAWRLALFRAERHGQPRLGRDTGPQWLSPALPRGAALQPGDLLQQARKAAVQALWQAGWRLRA